MLENAILDYLTNAVSAGEIAEQFNLHWGETNLILRHAKGEWDNIDVAEEGATLGQEQEQDLIIIRAVEALKEMAKKDKEMAK